MERQLQLNDREKFSRFSKDFADSTIFLTEFQSVQAKLRENWQGVCDDWEDGGEDFVLGLYNQWQKQFGTERSSLAITRLVADQEGNDESNDSTGLRVSKILESRKIPDGVKDKLKALINGQGIFESFYIDTEDENLKSKIQIPLRRYASFMKSVLEQFSKSKLIELCDFDHDLWAEKFYGKSKDLLAEINEGRTLGITEYQRRIINAEANESDQFFLEIPINSYDLNSNLAEFTISNSVKIVSTSNPIATSKLENIISNTSTAEQFLAENHKDSIYIAFASRSVPKWISKIFESGETETGIRVLSNVVQSWWKQDPEKTKQTLRILESAKIPYMKMLYDDVGRFRSQKWNLSRILQTIKPSIPEGTIDHYIDTYKKWSKLSFIKKMLHEYSNAKDILFAKVMIDYKLITIKEDSLDNL